MIDGEPTIGVIYEYKGNTYNVERVGGEDNFFKVKDVNDSNWYDAVMYSPEFGDTDYTFVRRKDDFCNKFSEVNEVEE